MATHNAPETGREPVLTRAGIVTALAILSALLVHFGAAQAGSWLNAHSNLIGGVILAVAPVVSALLARLHVTPLVAPRAADGSELVPAGSAPAVLDAAVVLARAAAASKPDAAPPA